MGLIDRRISKLIRKSTGAEVKPDFYTACRTSLSSTWQGFVALDHQSLWLVSRSDVRGVMFVNISPGNEWGQYPVGTQGYPRYRYQLVLLATGETVTIYPLAGYGGAELGKRLNLIYDGRP